MLDFPIDLYEMLEKSELANDEIFRGHTHKIYLLGEENLEYESEQLQHTIDLAICVLSVCQLNFFNGGQYKLNLKIDSELGFESLAQHMYDLENAFDQALQYIESITYEEVQYAMDSLLLESYYLGSGFVVADLYTDPVFDPIKINYN